MIYMHMNAPVTEKFGYLGKLSEAPTESYHVLHNTLFNERHKNQAQRCEERHRRCLADLSCIAIAHILNPA